MRPFQSPFKLNKYPRIVIIAPVAAYPMSNALGLNIPISPPTLLLAANASVEVVLMTGVGPERNAALD